MHGVTTNKPLTPNAIISFSPSLIPIKIIPNFRIYLMQNEIPKLHISPILEVFPKKQPMTIAMKIGEIGLLSNCKIFVPKYLLKYWPHKATEIHNVKPIVKSRNLFFIKGVASAFYKLNSY